MATNFQNQNDLAGVPPFMHSPADKRRYPRVETCLTAQWQGMSSRCSVRISDLSEGGCYVDSIAVVTVGEILSIRILDQTDGWLELPCVVAHHSRLGFGLRFLDLDELQRDQIRTLTDKH